jgi:hypothetical protein
MSITKGAFHDLRKLIEGHVDGYRRSRGQKPLNDFSLEDRWRGLAVIGDWNKSFAWNKDHFQKPRFHTRWGNDWRRDSFSLIAAEKNPNLGHVRHFIRALARFYTFISPTPEVLQLCNQLCSESGIDNFLPGQLVIGSSTIESSATVINAGFGISILDLLIASRNEHAICEFARDGFCSPNVVKALIESVNICDIFWKKWDEIDPPIQYETVFDGQDWFYYPLFYWLTSDVFDSVKDTLYCGNPLEGRTGLVRKDVWGLMSDEEVRDFEDPEKRQSLSEKYKIDSGGLLGPLLQSPGGEGVPTIPNIYFPNWILSHTYLSTNIGYSSDSDPEENPVEHSIRQLDEFAIHHFKSLDQINDRFPQISTDLESELRDKLDRDRSNKIRKCQSKEEARISEQLFTKFRKEARSKMFIMQKSLCEYSLTKALSTRRNSQCHFIGAYREGLSQVFPDDSSVLKHLLARATSRNIDSFFVSINASENPDYFWTKLSLNDAAKTEQLRIDKLNPQELEILFESNTENTGAFSCTDLLELALRSDESYSFHHEDLLKSEYKVLKKIS